MPRSAIAVQPLSACASIARNDEYLRSHASDAEGWIKLLRAAGWTLDRGGKHQVKMTKPGRRPVTLPENKRRAYSKRFEAQLRRETGLDEKG